MGSYQPAGWSEALMDRGILPAFMGRSTLSNSYKEGRSAHLRPTWGGTTGLLEGDPETGPRPPGRVHPKRLKDRDSPKMVLSVDERDQKIIN